MVSVVRGSSCHSDSAASVTRSDASSVSQLVPIAPLGAFVEAGEHDGAAANLILMSVAGRQSPLTSSAQAFDSWRPVLSASADAQDGFVLPSFVSYRDKLEIMALLCCVARGGFSGAQLASILYRAELRCDVAVTVGRQGLNFIEAQMAYEGAVRAIESKVISSKSSFSEDVSNIALVQAFCASGNAAARAGSVDPNAAKSVGCKVVGGNFAVATMSSGLSQGCRAVASLPNDMVVVPQCVYRAIMMLDVKVSGNSCSISLQRRADGVFVPVKSSDSMHEYQVDTMPSGQCVLPGAFDMVVSTQVLADYLQAILVLPKLRDQGGFCYLRMLPLQLRWSAYRQLGFEPRAGSLRAIYPSCQDWCSEDAAVHISRFDFRMMSKVWHCSEDGNLPHWVADGDLVGAAKRSAPPPDLLTDTQNILDDMMARASAAQANEERLPVDLPPRGHVRYASTASVTSAASSSVGPGGFAVMPSRSVSSGFRTVGFSKVDGPALAFSPDWNSVSDPAVREWANRMSRGPPVGIAELLDVSRCVRRHMPRLPVGIGTSAFLPPALCRKDPEADLAKFRSLTFPVDGWFAEICHVKKVSKTKIRKILLVPPVAGSMTRFEFTFESEVIVGDALTFEAGSHVLWLTAPVSVVLRGPGHICKLWCDGAAVGLGRLTSTMAMTFVAPALRRHSGGVVANSVVGMQLVDDDVKAGLTRYHKRLKVPSAGDKLHFFITDSTSEEPALITARRNGQTYVQAHGVRVHANDRGTCNVVVSNCQVTMSFGGKSADSGEKMNVHAVCVRDERFFSAATSAGVAGFELEYPASTNNLNAPLPAIPQAI